MSELTPLVDRIKTMKDYIAYCEEKLKGLTDPSERRPWVSDLAKYEEKLERLEAKNGRR